MNRKINNIMLRILGLTLCIGLFQNPAKTLEAKTIKNPFYEAERPLPIDHSIKYKYSPNTVDNPRHTLTDIMILEHPETERPPEDILTLMSAIKANWNILESTGILFDIAIEDISNTTHDVNVTNESDLVISGYSVVTTQREFQVRKYTKVRQENMDTDFEIIYRKSNLSCPILDVILSSKELYNSGYAISESLYHMTTVKLDTKGRYSGVITSYKDRTSSSLSEVDIYYYSVDRKDLLKDII